MIKSKQIEAPLELYIHIPFCVKKCAYCDFLSSAQDEETIEKYVSSLIKEIKAHTSKRRVATIFLGGGTPSILKPSQIKRVFDALRDAFEIMEDAEITIEANPGTVDEDKLLEYQKCGINRISFGLQSTNNQELRLLGRIHTNEEFIESYTLARRCGFKNINVDLISAIPKQTLKSWEETLRNVIALNPEHISAYSLIIEEGTPFAKVYGEGCPCEEELPDEETERKIYYRTEELLNAAGYHRYEISNYAKKGKECKHNLGYWERKEYLGFGIGAASLIGDKRYHNSNDLFYYLDNSGCLDKIQEDIELLSEEEQMEEFVFLGMRKISGISEKDFMECFGRDMNEVYGIQLEKLLKEKLIEKQEGQIRLTRQGIDVSNYVFAQFIK